jgi:hypothetical protein
VQELTATRIPTNTDINKNTFFIFTSFFVALAKQMKVAVGTGEEQQH